MKMQKVIMDINRMALSIYPIQHKENIIKEGTPILLIEAMFSIGNPSIIIKASYQKEEFEFSLVLQNVIKSQFHFFEILNEYFLINNEKGFDETFFPNGTKIEIYDRDDEEEEKVIRKTSNTTKKTVPSNTNKKIKKRRAKNKAAKKSRKK